MSKWEKIGLVAGVEIHQQLGTRKKLFCECSAALQDKEPVFEVKRKLRPVAGETGTIDTAAEYEALHDRTFRYKVYMNESCAVELDSEPPHKMNPEALEIALEVALLLNCKIPAEIHVMRKTVLDGSNTSGFQRTAVVGMNGWIDTSFGKVGVQLVAVEEDSCQILDRKKNIFGLNRLGIPLVEIATSPDIHTPEQGREVAEKIGMILRSSKVKRGLGTIRQDLNVSIKKGTRVEIKGVQDLRSIPKIIEIEAERQLSLAKSGKTVSPDVRKAEPDGTTKFLRPLPGASRMYPETDIPSLRIHDSIVNEIKSNLPELLEVRMGRMEKDLGLSKDEIKSLQKAGKLELFQQLKMKRLKPVFVLHLLLSYPQEIKRRNPKTNPGLVTEKDLKSVLSKADSGEISKDSVLDLLTEAALGRKIDFSRHRLGNIDIDSEVKKLLKEKPGLTFGAYMGMLMGKFRGRVSGDDIAKALKKAL